MILDPLLVDTGVAGALQTFIVAVYDQNQDPLENASVTPTRTTATGTQTLTALTRATGVATLVAVNVAGVTEYQASAGGTESNTIEIAALGG